MTGPIATDRSGDLILSDFCDSANQPAVDAFCAAALTGRDVEAGEIMRSEIECTDGEVAAAIAHHREECIGFARPFPSLDGAATEIQELRRALREMHERAAADPAFLALADDQAAWSQRTFGTDDERGPLGALRHLEKEAREAQAALDDRTEYADCFLLVLDAARRAGISAPALVQAAIAKMVVNKARTWPAPIDDTPVEHVKDAKAGGA